MMIASWNKGGNVLKEILTANFAQFDFVARSCVAEPQQWESATYWKDLPCVSMSLIGDEARPTSSRRLGVDIDDLDENLQAVCLGFAMQPCMQRRMKSNVSSEPELTGI